MAGETELDARTRLTEALWNDPEIRAQFLEPAIVKKFPAAKAQLPHIEAREVGAQFLDEARKLNEETRSRLAKADDQKQREAAIRAIQNDPELHIKDDEVAEVEKLMIDETIGSHRAAAKLLRASQQVASPSVGPYSMDIPGHRGAGGEGYKWLADAIGKGPEELDRAAHNQAVRILDDFKAGRGQQWT